MTSTTFAPARTSAPGGPLIAVPLEAPIGAEVRGLRLAQLGPGPDLARLRQLLADHQVLVFRDQDLGADELGRLAANFGRLTVHPVDRLTGSDRSVSTIVDSAEHPPAGFTWHTDLSWLALPPRFGFLAAVEIPPHGGDTRWVSGTTVWERLDLAARQELAGRLLVHRPDASLVATVRRHHGEDVAAELVRRHPAVAHPLVRAHPDTRRPGLFLSPMYAEHLLGETSAGLLDEVQGLLDEPELQLRWRWRAGDVVIWDEAATVHRADTDHFPDRRVVRRCTTDGPRPRPWRAGPHPAAAA
jgi:taurine dioxygenase